MPHYDSRGQNIPYPALTDAPNIQIATEGIVEGLAERSVMRFNSANVRGATLTNPAAGMLSYLNDTGSLEMYNGSAWLAFALGTSVWTNLPVGPGWQLGDGGSAPIAQYRVVSEHGELTLKFRGNIHRPSYPGSLPNSWITISGENNRLPEPARPVAIRRTTAACSRDDSSQGQVRLDVRADGEMRLYDMPEGVRPPWISFDGVSVSL